MKATALRLSTGFGIDALTFDEINVPAPGAGEVLVRIGAVSLNYRDLLVTRGHYNPKLAFPATIGSDAAGEVVEVGKGVTAFKEGDRVVAGFMPAWKSGPIDRTGFDSALGGGELGVMQTHCIFHETALVTVPQSFSLEEAATLPCAGVTAWNALVETGNVGPSDTVLLLGTGGVSIFALQIAKLRGAKTILTSSSDEKLLHAKSLGADHTINYRTQPKWDKAVRELTGGQGATHVVEVGGAGTLPLSLRSAAFNAQVSLIGVLTGATEPFDVLPVLMHSLCVQGIYVGSVAMLCAIAETFDQAGIKPVIDRTFNFSEAQQALRYLESAAHFGKIVLRIS